MIWWGTFFSSKPIFRLYFINFNELNYISLYFLILIKKTFICRNIYNESRQFFHIQHILKSISGIEMRSFAQAKFVCIEKVFRWQLKLNCQTLCVVMLYGRLCLFMCCQHRIKHFRLASEIRSDRLFWLMVHFDDRGNFEWFSTFSMHFFQILYFHCFLMIKSYVG